jgi:hypothetical protein
MQVEECYGVKMSSIFEAVLTIQILIAFISSQSGSPDVETKANLFKFSF